MITDRKRQPTNSPVATLVLAFMAMALASCQFAPENPQYLDFKSTIFESGDQTRRADKYGFGRLQFIAAEKGSRRAAIVFVDADDFGIIADTYHQTRTFLRTWKELSRAKLEFAEEAYLEVPIGKVKYERFSYSGSQCFQFYIAFGRSLTDALSRERSIIAGYFCDDTGTRPETAEITSFLNGLGLTDQDNWKSIPKEDTRDLFDPKWQMFELRINTLTGSSSI